MADVLVILVVEDELLIQDLLKDTLHDGGYEVAIASSGEEAIKLLDAQNPKYRALVTDINLDRGQIDGWDVAKHARELEHDLPVVYMTGDSAGDWASRGVPNSVLITKPYAPRTNPYCRFPAAQHQQHAGRIAPAFATARIARKMNGATCPS